MSLPCAFDQVLSNWEKVLNIAGYIPFVSMLSSAVRVLYAKVLIIGGVAQAAFKYIARFFTLDPEKKAELMKECQGCLLYSFHGVLNIGRAAVESIPLISLIVCLAYDLVGFRFCYPSESPRLRNPISLTIS